MLIGSTFADFTAGSKVFERSPIYIEAEHPLVFLQQYRVSVPTFVSYQILDHLHMT